MADIKTKPTGKNVNKFLESIENEQRRKDSYDILEIMKNITKSEPKMWGPSIIGFGDTHYKYKSGRENDWFKVGFSPRKQNLTLYIMPGFDDYGSLLEKLGKHSIGKSCLYIKKLDDINMNILKELIKKSIE